MCDSEGNVDAAMYVSLNEPFGAVREMLFHTILKHYPFGGLVASALFDEVYIAELQVLSPLKLISIPSMEHRRVIRPEFGAPRKDHYEDTQKDAQDLYGRHPTAVGLAWSSARGLSYSAVLYESRVPADSIALAAPSRRLKDDPGLWDYTVQVLADHGIRVGTP